MVGRPSDRPSVRPSVPSIDSSNDGRWVYCWARCGQEMSIDSCGRVAGAMLQRARRAAGGTVPALSSKCGQRHVESRRRRLNTDLLKVLLRPAFLCRHVPKSTNARGPVVTRRRIIAIVRRRASCRRCLPVYWEHTASSRGGDVVHCDWVSEWVRRAFV